MGNIKCSQCGYFENMDSGYKRCSRYDIKVETDELCVDSDESNNSDSYM